MPWTRFFRRAADSGGPSLNDLMGGLSRLFEGMGEEEVFEVACREVSRIFACQQASLMWHLPKAGEREGEWTLEVSSGPAAGAKVTRADAQASPELIAGQPLAYSEELAHRAMLKAIALAYEHGEFYGCDQDERQVVLLQDPGPADDLGSGDLALLAIPLVYHHRVGRVLERARVGVIVLYGLPVACDLRPLEGFLRSLIGYAVTTPSCSLRDPVTGLYTRHHFRAELERYTSAYRITGRKLGGGVVVCKVEALRHYQQRVEVSGNLPPRIVGKVVSDLLRRIGAQLTRLCGDYALAGMNYSCGVPARLGPDAFGALLPLLKPEDLTLWARRLGRAVEETGFPDATGRHSPVTLSLRVIPFGGGPAGSDPGQAWALVEECLEFWDRNQPRPSTNHKERPALDLRLFTAQAWEPLAPEPSRSPKPPLEQPLPECFD